MTASVRELLAHSNVYNFFISWQILTKLAEKYIAELFTPYAVFRSWPHFLCLDNIEKNQDELK